MRQTFIPNIWFDGHVEEAAEWYTQVLRSGKVLHTARYTDAGKAQHGHNAGDVMTVEFEAEGARFILLNGGPNVFTLSPAVSFTIYRTSAAEIDELGAVLAEGGKVLMPVQTYPFSERYGWVQDKYGVSWQLMMAPEEHATAPSLLFTGERVGKAEEALRYYADVFGGSVGTISHYPAGMEPDKEGTLQYGDMTVDGQMLIAMDSAQPHEFTADGAISLMVECDDQAEIDRLWEKLSAVPEAEQCGWCLDQFGVMWQITPRELDQMLRDGSPEQVERVTTAFMAMKKFDLDALRRAYAGK